MSGKGSFLRQDRLVKQTPSQESENHQYKNIQIVIRRADMFQSVPKTGLNQSRQSKVDPSTQVFVLSRCFIRRWYRYLFIP